MMIMYENDFDYQTQRALTGLSRSHISKSSNTASEPFFWTSKYEMLYWTNTCVHPVMYAFKTTRYRPTVNFTKLQTTNAQSTLSECCCKCGAQIKQCGGHIHVDLHFV